MPVMETTVKRRTSAERKHARNLDKKRRKHNRRKIARPTAKQRRATQRMKAQGLFKKIGAIRSHEELPATMPSGSGHSPDYISAVLEQAATDKGFLGVQTPPEGATPQSANDLDMRAFAKHFLDKPALFSKTPQGLAAIQFEAWLISAQGSLYERLVEVVVENGKKDFLAIFEGKLNKEETEALVGGVAGFTKVVALVCAGDHAPSTGEISDVTIFGCTPVGDGKPAQDDQPDMTQPPPENESDDDDDDPDDGDPAFMPDYDDDAPMDEKLISLIGRTQKQLTKPLMKQLATRFAKAPGKTRRNLIRQAVAKLIAKKKLHAPTVWSNFMVSKVGMEEAQNATRYGCRTCGKEFVAGDAKRCAYCNSPAVFVMGEADVEENVGGQAWRCLVCGEQWYLYGSYDKGFCPKCGSEVPVLMNEAYVTTPQGKRRKVKNLRWAISKAGKTVVDQITATKARKGGYVLKIKYGDGHTFVSSYNSLSVMWDWLDGGKNFKGAPITMLGKSGKVGGGGWTAMKPTTAEDLDEAEIAVEKVGKGLVQLTVTTASPADAAKMLKTLGKLPNTYSKPIKRGPKARVTVKSSSPAKAEAALRKLLGENLDEIAGTTRVHGKPTVQLDIVCKDEKEAKKAEKAIRGEIFSNTLPVERKKYVVRLAVPGRDATKAEADMRTFLTKKGITVESITAESLDEAKKEVTIKNAWRVKNPFGKGYEYVVEFGGAVKKEHTFAYYTSKGAKRDDGGHMTGYYPAVDAVVKPFPVKKWPMTFKRKAADDLKKYDSWANPTATVTKFEPSAAATAVVTFAPGIGMQGLTKIRQASNRTGNPIPYITMHGNEVHFADMFKLPGGKDAFKEKIAHIIKKALGYVTEDEDYGDAAGTYTITEMRKVGPKHVKTIVSKLRARMAIHLVKQCALKGPARSGYVRTMAALGAGKPPPKLTGKHKEGAEKAKADLENKLGGTVADPKAGAGLPKWKGESLDENATKWMRCVSCGYHWATGPGHYAENMCPRCANVNVAVVKESLDEAEDDTFTQMYVEVIDEDQDSIISLYGTWMLDEADDGTVTAVIFNEEEGDEAYELAANMTDARALLHRIETVYEGLPAEFDAMAEAFFTEYGENEGTALDFKSTGGNDGAPDGTTDEFILGERSDRDAAVALNGKMRLMAQGTTSEARRRRPNPAKTKWMGRFDDKVRKAVKLKGKPPRDYWDGATFFFNQGMKSDDAADKMIASLKKRGIGETLRLDPFKAKSSGKKNNYWRMGSAAHASGKKRTPFYNVRLLKKIHGLADKAKQTAMMDYIAGWDAAQVSLRSEDDAPFDEAPRKMKEVPVTTLASRAKFWLDQDKKDGPYHVGLGTKKGSPTVQIQSLKTKKWQKLTGNDKVWIDRADLLREGGEGTPTASPSQPISVPNQGGGGDYPMKRCEECGNRYEKTDKACPECGSKKSQYMEGFTLDAVVDHIRELELVEAVQQLDERDTVTASLEKCAEDKPTLATTYTQYIKRGNAFEPVGPLVLAPVLERCAYKIVSSFTGPVFEKVMPRTDELYVFEDSPMSQVVEEIDRFWELKPNFDKLGLMHNRGILMYGPPGMGKSCGIQQTAEMMTERGDVVFYASNIGLLKEALNRFREVETDRKVVVVLEEADEYVGYQTNNLARLLDGEDAVGGVLYLATTNYLERFPQKLLRPGRFDKLVEVGPPPLAGRKVYLQHKLADVEDAKVIAKLAAETDGMSFGHLRELVIRAYAFEEPVAEVVKALKTRPLAESAADEATVHGMQQATAAMLIGRKPVQIAKAVKVASKGPSEALATMAGLLATAHVGRDQDKVKAATAVIRSMYATEGSLLHEAKDGAGKPLAFKDVVTQQPLAGRKKKGFVIQVTSGAAMVGVRWDDGKESVVPGKSLRKTGKKHQGRVFDSVDEATVRQLATKPYNIHQVTGSKDEISKVVKELTQVAKITNKRNAQAADYHIRASATTLFIASRDDEAGVKGLLGEFKVKVESISDDDVDERMGTLTGMKGMGMARRGMSPKASGGRKRRRQRTAKRIRMTPEDDDDDSGTPESPEEVEERTGAKVPRWMTQAYKLLHAAWQQAGGTGVKWQPRISGTFEYPYEPTLKIEYDRGTGQDVEFANLSEVKVWLKKTAVRKPVLRVGIAASTDEVAGDVTSVMKDNAWAVLLDTGHSGNAAKLANLHKKRGPGILQNVVSVVTAGAKVLIRVLGHDKKLAVGQAIRWANGAANDLKLLKKAVAKGPGDRLQFHESDLLDPSMEEVSPPGFSGTVKAMKAKHPEIDNPWALAWSMYNKGAKPHYAPEKGKPKYKRPKGKKLKMPKGKQQKLAASLLQQWMGDLLDLLGVEAVAETLARHLDFSDTDEAKPVGKAQSALMAVLTTKGSGDHSLASLSRASVFRGIHFKKIQSAAKALGKKGLLTYDGISKVSLNERKQYRKPDGSTTWKGFRTVTKSAYNKAVKGLRSKKIGANMTVHYKDDKPHGEIWTDAQTGDHRYHIFNEPIKEGLYQAGVGAKMNPWWTLDMVFSGDDAKRKTGKARRHLRKAVKQGNVIMQPQTGAVWKGEGLVFLVQSRTAEGAKEFIRGFFDKTDINVDEAEIKVDDVSSDYAGGNLCDLDIATLAANLDDDELQEATFGRIVQHMKNLKDGFVMVSADRSERAGSENKAARKKAWQVIRSAGKGFVKVKGGYVETTPEGDKQDVDELTMFVPKVSKGLARSWAKTFGKAPYKQEAILWGKEGEGAFFMYPSGKVEKVGDTISMQNVGQYYTKFQNRKFAFVTKEKPKVKVTVKPAQYVAASMKDALNWAKQLRDSQE